MGVEEGPGSTFVIRDSGGKFALRITSQDQNGTNVELVDDTGKVRTRISMKPHGESELSLVDTVGNELIGLHTETGAGPEVFLAGPGGQKRLLLSVFDNVPRLSVSDTTGRTRISLGDFESDSNAHGIQVIGAKGELGVQIVSPEAGLPYLTVHSTGLRRIVLQGGDNGDQKICLVDENNVTRAGIGTNADGRPYLALVDENGETRMAAMCYETGDWSMGLYGKTGSGQMQFNLYQKTREGQLLVKDSNGRRRVVIGVDSATEPFIKLNDRNGNENVALGNDPDGNATLRLLHDNKTRVRTFLDDTGNPAFELLDADGKVVWRAAR